jgi:hypothetical protein
VTKKDGSRTRLPLSALLPLLGLTSANLYAAATGLEKFGETYDPAYLEISLWAFLPSLAISYGLAKFNGVKNTASDLAFGFNSNLRAFAGWLRKKYSSTQLWLGTSEVAKAFMSLPIS